MECAKEVIKFRFYRHRSLKNEDYTALIKFELKLRIKFPLTSQAFFFFFGMESNKSKLLSPYRNFLSLSLMSNDAKSLSLLILYICTRSKLMWCGEGMYMPLVYSIQMNIYTHNDFVNNFLLLQYSHPLPLPFSLSNWMRYLHRLN